jgi:hypothetical protein
MYKEKIVNVATGEETWRDYTDAEIAEVEAAQLQATQRLAQEQAKEETRLAVLAKLGLTPEDISALGL